MFTYYSGDMPRINIFLLYNISKYPSRLLPMERSLDH